MEDVNVPVPTQKVWYLYLLELLKRHMQTAY